MSIARRYGYRVVAAWFVIALCVSVWADVQVARPASADAVTWASDAYSSISSGCNWLADVGDKLRTDPGALFTAGFSATTSLAVATALNGGALGGQAGYVALGGAAAVGSGATVGGTAGSVGAFVGGSTAGASTVAAAVPVMAMAVGVCGKTLNDQGSLGRVRLAGGSYSATQEVSGGQGVLWGTGLSVVNCPAGSAETDVCLQFLWDNAPAGNKDFWWVKTGPGPIWTYTGSGNESLSPSLPIFGANPTYVYPDAGLPWYVGIGRYTGASGTFSVRVQCGSDPTCYQDDDSLIWVASNIGGTNYKSSFPGARVISEARGVAWRGQLRRDVATTTCKIPGGSSTSVVEYSPSYWDDQGSSGWLPDGCPFGRAPVAQTITRERVGGGESPVTLSSYTLPTALQNNATSLQCWVSGMTSCPMYDNGNGTKSIGGPAGVVQSNTAGQTLRTTLLDALGTPADSWVDDPAPTTTTVPQATSTTIPESTTTAVPQPECPDAPGCPGDEDPPEGSEAECWPSGWGWFNPAEWVLKPIKCALVWAFWDDDVADEVAGLGAEHGWTQLVSDSSISTSATAGPCIDFETWTSVCTSAVTDVEMPSGVTSVLVAAVLFFGLFEVIGLFARITGGS